MMSFQVKVKMKDGKAVDTEYSGTLPDGEIIVSGHVSGHGEHNLHASLHDEHGNRTVHTTGHESAARNEEHGG